ncbi:MAG: hypothetical protein BRC53_14790 [Cyanobacteria bacterium SW_6_48_11]|nr:MAG: hypothetical protein BRC53_14790 [Cyanobacteria bacterium SW_6_48_11]
MDAWIYELQLAASLCWLFLRFFAPSFFILPHETELDGSTSEEDSSCPLAQIKITAVSSEVFTTSETPHRRLDEHESCI